MNALRAFFKISPMEWSSREMFVMRMFFACVIAFAAIPWNLDPSYAAMEKPNGLARIVPLAWMLRPDVLVILKLLTGIGLGGYVMGFMPVVTLFPALVTAAGLGALRNSAGNISHHLQVAVMILLAQYIVYIVAAARGFDWRRALGNTQRQAVLWAIIIIAASYTASGIMKLKVSRFQWVQNCPAMGVQSMKSNLSQHYSDGEQISVFETETMPQWLGNHPAMSRLIFTPGLILELTAALLLFNRRLSCCYGIALILMHFGISLIMKIEFWNHMFVVAIFCINLPGLFFRRAKALTSVRATIPD